MKATRYKKILVLGGARSGKSAFALKLGAEFKGSKAYIATAEPLDTEMRERIESHKKSRSDGWDTIEEPMRVPDLISDASSKYSLILVDCLTLWLSNIMAKMDKDQKSKVQSSKFKVMKEIDKLIEKVNSASSNIVLVSNEVGMGIVPDNGSARSFRDLSGLMNQKIAEVSNEVHIIFSGIPVRIK